MAPPNAPVQTSEGKREGVVRALLIGLANRTGCAADTVAGTGPGAAVPSHVGAPRPGRRKLPQSLSGRRRIYRCWAPSSVLLGCDMTNTCCCCRSVVAVCVRGVRVCFGIAPRGQKAPNNFPRKRHGHVLNAPGCLLPHAQSQRPGGAFIAVCIAPPPMCRSQQNDVWGQFHLARRPRPTRPHT